MVAVRRVAGLVAMLAALVPKPATAEPLRCVHLDLEPVARVDLEAGNQRGVQLVAWIEDTAGTFVDTIFITAQTGSFGIGNRPGRADFNSGPNWPYGRRITTFPVWAHKKTLYGSPDLLTFPEVGFQNGDEDNLSHPLNQSSRETHFCRPLQSTGQDKTLWDAGSCASAINTDKGVMGAVTSLYPPRQDIAPQQYDSSSVETFNMFNPFDAVSQATPRDGERAELSWPLPRTLPGGDYVVWIEVSREFDHNATYSASARPAPAGIPWAEYGEPFRGQPSVLYRVPFTVGPTETTATALDYVGYGDPDGLDGSVRAPDATITSSVQGSGSSRLAVISDGGSTFRVRVISSPETDYLAPGPVTHVAVDSQATRSTISFLSPPDDPAMGRVRGYDVHYLVGETVTEDNFADALDAHAAIALGDPGTMHHFDLTKLLPLTEYSIGIRAFDACRNVGPLTVFTFTTPERLPGEVDACFIATAAYGSVLAADVEMLRRFRDLALKRTVLGELFVETYYTFGPPVAGVIGESELLRATSRTFLAPLVSWVKAFQF
jgi:hypothetical protein